jgi:hypothetical protein
VDLQEYLVMSLSRGSVSIGMMGAIGVGVLVLILIGLAVVFGSRRDGDAVVVTPTMHATAAGATPAAAIPPIEAAAPAEAEVATFALG